MATIKTDDKHYTDIANAMREATGLNLSYLPEEMAEAVMNVYNKGYNDGLREVKGDVMKFVRVLDTLTLTQEDVDAAGDAGVTMVTVGSPDLDLSAYSEVFIRLWVPSTSDYNTANSALMISVSNQGTYNPEDGYLILRNQSASYLSTTLEYKRSNMIAITLTYSGNGLIKGEAMKGAAASYAYPGQVLGWDYWASSKCNKAQTKYFHIRSYDGKFKFPKNTQVVVLAR